MTLEDLDRQIYDMTQKRAALAAAAAPREVKDYVFATLEGEVPLSDLFAGRERLFVIHNMGQGCRYCTLWADGLNGILDHLEDAFSVVLVSKDPPELQRRFAQSRGWRFRLASHGNGPYAEEEAVMQKGMPGAVVYEREGQKILRRGATAFGPGDLYSPIWHILGLAGIGMDQWTPQFSYWTPPDKLDDGGENAL